jgi:hypothetical protein
MIPNPRGPFRQIEVAPDPPTQGANDNTSDVLLPETYAENKSHGARQYEHLQRQLFLESVPPSIHVFALVCVGRFSRSFLIDVMERLWLQGVVSRCKVDESESIHR